MGLIHVRNPLVLLGYNYFKFYWFDQSNMGSLLTGYLVTNSCPAPLGVGRDFIFQETGCASVAAVPRRIWDYGRRHCAASWLDGVLCRVLRVPKSRMDDNSQTLH